MTALPEFRLETLFAKWEFSARHHMTASDAESMPLPELLEMATPADREAFEALWLGYCETRGAPDLREAIAATYVSRCAEDILCLAGAQEGIFATITTLLEAGDHAIVVVPGYQSMESLAAATCDVSAVPLEATSEWDLDIDRIQRAMRRNTKLVLANFPNNPTGAILHRSKFDALVEICRTRGIYLFNDEVYRPLGHSATVHLPQVADVYEKGISLGVTSKAYGLPGLRIGWLATADRELLHRIEKTKHYLSICNSGPSERLAVIALKARHQILRRNVGLVSRNLPVFREFLQARPDLFEWTEPHGGCIAYPRYTGPGSVETFAERLVREAGVFVAPASIFRSSLTATPDDRFRVGFGRKGLEPGLAAMAAHLDRVYPQ